MIGSYLATATTILERPHPTDSRSPLTLAKQIRQAPTGAEAMLVGAAGDPGAVGRALQKQLAQVGVAGPCVDVRVVDRLQRQAAGKVRRFQPISG